MILAPSGQPARSIVGPSKRPRASSMQYAFDAARFSGYRGYFYFPSLEPADQMTQWTRQEIACKLNWAYNNIGFMRMAIDGVAEDDIDVGIWPRATTENPHFNKAVTDLWDSEAGDARFFDEAAVENVYTAQLAIRRHIYLHGEIFAQLLRPSQGTEQATINFIPMWQIDNAVTQLDQSKWRDGIMTNEFGRPVQYRVLSNKQKTEWTDVPAGDMLHFHDPFWKGQLRGMSPLAAVARKIYSLDDIERATTSGELIRQRIAYAITKSNQDDDEPTLIPGATLVETIEQENSDGSKTKLHIQRITSKDGTGTDIDIADLPPGRELDIVESQKPSSAESWSNHMLRDVAFALKRPAEYLFDITGITQGTLTRLVLKRVQRSKNNARQFQVIPQFWKRIYEFKLWQWIKSGRFDGIQGGIPKTWWLVRYICPPDDTVDVARELRIYSDMANEGNMSPDDFQELRGRFVNDVDEELVATRIRRLKMIEDQRAALEARDPDYTKIAAELTYDQIFRQPARTTETKTVREQTTAVDNPDGPAPIVEPAPAPAKKSGKNGHSRNGHARLPALS